MVVTVTDNAGFSGSASFTWTITNTVTVTNPGNQTGTVGSHITPVSIAANDSSSTATLTYSATGLPSGLSINTSSGVITGTLTTSGGYSVRSLLPTMLGSAARPLSPGRSSAR